MFRVNGRVIYGSLEAINTSIRHIMISRIISRHPKWPCLFLLFGLLIFLYFPRNINFDIKFVDKDDSSCTFNVTATLKIHHRLFLDDKITGKIRIGSDVYQVDKKTTSPFLIQVDDGHDLNMRNKKYISLHISREMDVVTMLVKTAYPRVIIVGEYYGDFQNLSKITRFRMLHFG